MQKTQIKIKQKGFMILGKRALYFTGVTSDFKTKHVDHIYIIINDIKTSLKFYSNFILNKYNI